MPSSVPTHAQTRTIVLVHSSNVISAWMHMCMEENLAQSLKLGPVVCTHVVSKGSCVQVPVCVYIWVGTNSQSSPFPVVHAVCSTIDQLYTYVDPWLARSVPWTTNFKKKNLARTSLNAKAAWKSHLLVVSTHSHTIMLAYRRYGGPNTYHRLGTHCGS